MTLQRIVILYPELANYFVVCLNNWCAMESVEVHVFRKQVNKEAPFAFDQPHPNVHIYNEDEFDEAALCREVERIQPRLIYCAGWSDKKYLNVVKRYRKNANTLLGFDNKWFGNLKQQLLVTMGRFAFRHFDFAFVPGSRQALFGQKLGFPDDRILRNAYCADVRYFQKGDQDTASAKRQTYPRRFIFVGRYITIKGIFDLWQAFTELCAEGHDDWELWCLGTGSEWDNRVEHPKIKHFGFVQPNELANYFNETGVYILPSHFEPWGVSVHEMAAAGYPMILSDQIGAAEAFLEDGVNGYSVPAGDVKALKKAMLQCMNASDAELLKMQDESRRLSGNISHETWNASLMKALNASFQEKKYFN
ncbi:MAG: glycosyltransferase [Flavobacteriales bacterium]|nr:glycosyltransferase [Flavobacteriales bacterium]